MACPESCVLLHRGLIPTTVVRGHPFDLFVLIRYLSLCMTHFRATVLAIVAALTSLSCASDAANRYYADRKYPPKPVASVAVLSAEPKRPYEVIADFQSRGDSAKSLRAKAAKIGADAVIVTYLGGRYDPSEEWSQQTQAGDLYTRIVGTAIKYK